MLSIAAEIVRWVDDYQPGIVECCMVDAKGQEWRFIEKLPVVTMERLDSSSKYPRPAFLACQQLSPAPNTDVVTATTEHPWHIESVDGTTVFEVFAHQLVDYNWYSGE